MIKKSVRTILGKVISNKMNKTISIIIERRVMHPIYGKFIIKSSKVYAHDENNQCNIGDMVKVCETRPYSKMKSWKLLFIY